VRRPGPRRASTPLHAVGRTPGCVLVVQARGGWRAAGAIRVPSLSAERGTSLLGAVSRPADRGGPRIAPAAYHPPRSLPPRRFAHTYSFFLRCFFDSRRVTAPSPRAALRGCVQNAMCNINIDARGESDRGTPALRYVGRTRKTAIANPPVTALHYITSVRTPRPPTIITHPKDHSHTLGSVTIATSPSGPPPSIDKLLHSPPPPPQPTCRCSPAPPSTRGTKAGRAHCFGMPAEKGSNRVCAPLTNGQPNGIEPAVAAAATHSRPQLVRSLLPTPAPEHPRPYR